MNLQCSSKLWTLAHDFSFYEPSKGGIFVETFKMGTILPKEGDRDGKK